jgi:cysteine desulfurase
MKALYLDYNATTPVDPEVADAMMPFLRDNFGNPSSAHSYGLRARDAVTKARAQVAAMVGCEPDEVIFTSGGTEANNLAIKGYALAHRHRGNHILTSAIEHPAVLEVCRHLETIGFEITRAPVDGFGRLDPQVVIDSIRPATILISVMQANNEVGTLQPVEEIAAVALERGIVFHTDAAQAIGKVPVGLSATDSDMLSIAGHKLYAPKGVGALCVRRGIELQKQMHGAAHEHNRRAGTENVLEIVGLGQACEVVSRELRGHEAHLTAMRDLLQSRILELVPWARVNGHPELRLPNTLSISFTGIEANKLLARLEDVACSAGAACHSDRVVMSHVLEAMGVPVAQAMGTLRLSTGRMTTEAEIEQAARSVAQAVESLEKK